MGIISIKNLVHRFSKYGDNGEEIGEKTALEQVSLDIEKGSFVAILGHNGSGKSTLAKHLNALLLPTEGTVYISDKLSSDEKNLWKIRQSTGMVFQNPDNQFVSSVLEEDIAFGLENAQVPEREVTSKVKAALELVGLEGYEKRSPSSLSGGQKQRVAMARMIASEPDILLLDEPFSALDSYLKWELEQEMRDMLAEVQKPVLFVSHNRDEVYRLCSMVSCIDHGKMEVIEKTKEFFHNPKTKTAAVLSGCKNISAAEIVDNNHIKALGWGITLCVSEIPEETKAVGIRAHSFYPVNAEQIPGKESEANESRVSVIQEGTGLKKYRNPVQEENIFKIEESRIIEDPFEWNISFRPSKESGWLQWKIAKTEQEDSPGPIPPALAVHAKDILLLKDNAYE